MHIAATPLATPSRAEVQIAAHTAEPSFASLEGEVSSGTEAAGSNLRFEEGRVGSFCQA